MKREYGPVIGIAVIFATCSLGAQGALSPAAQDGGRQGGGGSQRIDWNAKAPWGPLRNIPRDAQAKEPFKIFDNVYYVGLQTVAAYLITASDGLVLLDATYADTADRVLDSVRKLGFDPKNIKYVLVSHAHGDHYAGAGRIQQETGARVGLSAADWEVVERQQGGASSPNNGLLLKRDLVVNDGDTLKVGNATFKFYVSPGHTPGALSMEYQVFDGGKSYRAVGPGGLGLTFGSEWTAPFIESTERLKQLGPWDVLLPNHGYMGPRDLFEVEKELATRGQGPNPAVLGSNRIAVWFEQVLATARQKLAAEQQIAR